MPIIVRVILAVAMLGFGFHWWGQRSERLTITRAMDQSGFLPVPMPSGAERDTVLIFAPVNCPKEAAQRAAVLAEKLTNAGIPNLRTSVYPAQAFAPTDENHAAYKRLNVVMTGEIPIALINGMGKANPSADEVASVYYRTRKPG